MIGKTISHYPAVPRLPLVLKLRTVGAKREKILEKLGQVGNLKTDASRKVTNNATNNAAKKNLTM
jgi:hypothetical protein